MNNLTIKGFINEMSYNLTMQELEALVIDYQDVLIDYFVNNRYSYKNKVEFNEVCELVRSDKYMKTISALINDDNPYMKTDMTYVLYSATYKIDDEELKNEAFRLGYRLRELDPEFKSTGHKETDIVILMAMTKTVKNYITTPFFRSKEVENILENLPEILYYAYHKTIQATSISENVLSTILSRAVIDLQAEEIIAACCKVDFSEDMDERFKPYASRIRAFLYKIIGCVSEEKLAKALSSGCNSIDKFNKRCNRNETLMNKYLNYKLLEAVVYSKDVKVPELMKQAYTRMTEFKVKNQEFSYLF